MRRSLAMFVVLAFVVVSAMFERPAAAQEPEPGILDEVAATLRQASPGTEGTVWRDTTGNRLPGAASDWLLQTPRCWGTIACPDQVGTRKLLQTLTDEIAAARVSVTITTLWPFADGGFETTIVEGLRRSLAAGNRPLVRWLGGSPFFYSYTGQGPDALRDKILRRPGTGGSTAPDRRGDHDDGPPVLEPRKDRRGGRPAAIVGGHNMWAVDYLSPTPVSDLSMLAAGPAAEAANGFADILWNYVCDRQAQGFLSQLLWIRYSASGPVGGCPRTTPVRPPGTPGSTRILVVGRLGQGIAIPGTLGSPISDLIQLLCPGFREDRADEARNPGLVAGRALIAAADERLFISQQDLLAMCPRSDPEDDGGDRRQDRRRGGHHDRGHGRVRNLVREHGLALQPFRGALLRPERPARRPGQGSIPHVRQPAPRLGADRSRPRRGRTGRGSRITRSSSPSTTRSSRSVPTTCTRRACRSSTSSSTTVPHSLRCAGSISTRSGSGRAGTRSSTRTRDAARSSAAEATKACSLRCGRHRHPRHRRGDPRLHDRDVRRGRVTAVERSGARRARREVTSHGQRRSPSRAQGGRPSAPKWNIDADWLAVASNVPSSLQRCAAPCP